MKPRPFDKLPESCKCCRYIIGLETDECKCSWADDNFEWEIMDNAFCIRFKFGYSEELIGN
ncbi:MAG: hypothetical protein ACFFDF_14150 [Candidatus Odinarchaeota archaeon]